MFLLQNKNLYYVLIIQLHKTKSFSLEDHQQRKIVPLLTGKGWDKRGLKEEKGREGF